MHSDERSVEDPLSNDETEKRRRGPVRKSKRGGWTPEEDEILRAAVKEFNGRCWKRIAARLPNRTNVQCLHRWQKVLNPELVKGPWTPEEDEKIIELVKLYGCENWSLIASHLEGRIGKQCRERYFNQLDPSIKKSPWTEEEKRLLMEAHRELGNKWAEISKIVSGRPSNQCKNMYHSIMTKMKKEKGGNDKKNGDTSDLDTESLMSETSTNISEYEDNSFPYHHNIGSHVMRNREHLKRISHSRSYSDSAVLHFQNLLEQSQFSTGIPMGQFGGAMNAYNFGHSPMHHFASQFQQSDSQNIAMVPNSQNLQMQMQHDTQNFISGMQDLSNLQQNGTQDLQQSLQQNLSFPQNLQHNLPNLQQGLQQNLQQNLEQNIQQNLQNSLQTNNFNNIPSASAMHNMTSIPDFDNMNMMTDTNYIHKPISDVKEEFVSNGNQVFHESQFIKMEPNAEEQLDGIDMEETHFEETLPMNDVLPESDIFFEDTLASRNRSRSVHEATTDIFPDFSSSFLKDDDLFDNTLNQLALDDDAAPGSPITPTFFFDSPKRPVRGHQRSYSMDVTQLSNYRFQPF